MQSIETVPSPSLDFTGQKTLGVIASTNHVEIAPKYGGKFKAGEIIRLEIPSQNWLDGEKFRVTFRGKTYSDVGNLTEIPLFGKETFTYEDNANPAVAHTGYSQQVKYGMFKNGVQHCIHRIKLLQGSRVIEDIQEYGQLAHLLHVATIPEDYKEEILQKEGFAYTDDFEGFDERKKQPSKPEGHMYELEFYLGLFRTGKLLPTKYMGQLTLELYLEQNAVCLLSSQSRAATASPPTEVWAVADGETTDYPNLSYEISDVFAQCHFAVPIDEYDRAALAQIEAGSFEIHYDTFRTHTRQTNAVNRQTISIQEKALSVKNVFTIMRNQVGLNSLIYDTHLARNACTEYQWKIGNEYFPAQPVKVADGGVRALTQLREALGGTSDMLQNGQMTHYNYAPTQRISDTEATFPVKLTNANNFENIYRNDRKIWQEVKNHQSMPNHFIIGQSFEKSQGQLSGFNTVQSQVDIELILQLDNHQLASLAKNTDFAEDTGKAAAGALYEEIKFQPLKAPVQVLSRSAKEIIPQVHPVVNNLSQTGQKTYVTLSSGLSDGMPYYMKESTGTNDFTQILAFVQVDATLRMRSLGQMEIIS